VCAEAFADKPRTGDPIAGDSAVSTNRKGLALALGRAETKEVRSLTLPARGFSTGASIRAREFMGTWAEMI